MIVVQYHIGEITDKRKECIKQLQLSLPLHIGYELITNEIKVPEYIGDHSIRKDSGFVRLMLLKENPDRIWIDTDVMCNKWHPIKEGTPHIFKGNCAAAIMYLKGFDQIDLVINKFAKSRALCMHWLLTQYVKFNYIPSECFTHLQLIGKGLSHG